MAKRPPQTARARAARRRRLLIALGAFVVLGAILGRVIVHYAAEITVKGAFYDALGMGSAYSTRWHTNVTLALIGIGVAALLAVPVALLARGITRPRIRVPDAPEVIDLHAPGRSWEDMPPLSETFNPAEEQRARRSLLVVWGAAVGVFAILASSLGAGLVSARDEILAWRNGVEVGATDPIFGQDLGFFFFTEPAISQLLALAIGGLVVSLMAVLGTAGALGFVRHTGEGPPISPASLRRAATPAFLLGGLLVIAIGGVMWLSRYALAVGGDDAVAGAGTATRDVDIPARTVGAVLIWALGLGILALAIPALRRRAAGLSARQATIGALGVWAVVVVALMVVSTPWWIVLLVPVVGGLAAIVRDKRVLADQTTTPIWAFPAAAVASMILISVLGPAGAALNDAVVLRGSTLQVERPNIEATLESTRRAAGIDDASETSAEYRRNGVTRKAIDAAPASVGSLRFLDIPPTEAACSRLQTFNQFYQCEDIDIGRGVFEGRPRTVFTAGREIDFSRLSDFQRLHFTFTHGYGFVAAPVDQIDESGRPVWVAGNIPQRGVDPPLQNPEIYFGAQPGVPWAMVNTDQPVFTRQGENRRVEWGGDTGVEVGSGWRRFAITEFLGGLPFIGGGRRVWNATSGRPADADSDLLLYRDIGSRMREMAPFLQMDGDPYFAAADGRLFVLAAMYATTSRYPYAAEISGTRYMRQSAMAVMDVYSGKTWLYVLDDEEPITRVWRDVYPALFTPLSEMPDGLRRHLRYGEALFDFQGTAVEKFHVRDPEVFFNGDEAWAPTEEAYGSGVDGQRIVSPARYSFAVLPGETRERFVGIRSYKPRTRGRGIGFSGWLAVSNEPEDFGKLTILRFPTTEGSLDSLDTFTANVSRDPSLSQEIQTRRDSVRRGNTIVVPIGEGLLYVQPLYLDSAGDPLPTLWQVVVSLGDGQVYFAPTFAEALSAALGATSGSDAPASAPTGPGRQENLNELVRRAAAEFEAYRRAFGRGDDVEAQKRLRAFQDALERARALADGNSATPEEAPATEPPPVEPPPATPEP